MSPDAFELVLRLAQCLNYDDGTSSVEVYVDRDLWGSIQAFAHTAEAKEKSARQQALGFFFLGVVVGVMATGLFLDLVLLAKKIL